MFFSYGCMFWRCIYNRSGRSLVEGLVVFLPLVIGLWIHTSHVAQPKWCAILWWYNFFGEPCSNEKVHKKLSVFEFMVRKSKKHTIWKKQFGSNQWELLQEAGHFQNNWWNTSWWLNQPIWKILVWKWESSPNGDEHKQIFELPPPRTCYPSTVLVLSHQFSMHDNSANESAHSESL